MKHNRVMNRRGGFTLIEMLVVAALIAIFAGLAVFNIIEELQREKSKAAIAETRSIATAMSFAYQDLSFFPKLCFLKYSVIDLAKLVSDDGLGPDAIAAYNCPINPTSLGQRWSKTKYLAGSMPDKYCRMTLTSADGKTYDWPRDPFNQPYVGYFIKMKKPTAGTGQPYPTWIEKAGDQADYFAGIVSYGRNSVPGMLDVNMDANFHSPQDFDADVRRNARLYTPMPGNPRAFTLLPTGDFADTGGVWPNIETPLGAFLGTQSGQTPNAQRPGIRETGSDDVFYEF